MRETMARGHPVRMVNRSGQTPLPAGVELVAGDAADRRFAREACAGARVVYQCLNPPYHRWPQLFPRMQAGVIEGAASAEAKLVSMDNLYMYGPTYGKPLSEKTPVTPSSRKGTVRAQMAEALLNAHAKGRVRATIGRASDFFGPEVLESAIGARVFGPALRGAPASVIGDTAQPHTYSYVPDVARALVMLGHRDEADGEVWHLPSPDTVTTREMLTMIYAEAGHTPRVRRAGKAMVRLIGFFNAQVREIVEMMYLFEEPFVVDDSKFKAAFGDIATPMPEAIRATIEWYRAELGIDVEPESASAEAETDASDEVAAEESIEEIDADDQPAEEEELDQKSSE